MEKEIKYPLPPWDMDSAAQKLQFFENDWNSLDPEQVAANYAADAEMRFGTSFLTGRDEIKKFLAGKWQQTPGFKIKFDLWGALKGRMAVRFEYEWHNAQKQWYRSYGVQVFQFNDNGLVQLTYASYNDELVAQAERKL